MLTLKQIDKVARLMEQTDYWAKREAELELARIEAELGAQKGPSSVAKIEAETKMVKRELA